MMTYLGRVVYDRKHNPFKLKDATRIVKSFDRGKTFAGTFAILLAILTRIWVEMRPERGTILSASVAFLTLVVQYLGEDLHSVYNELGDILGVPRAPPEPAGVPWPWL